jgi:signal peptidase II
MVETESPDGTQIEVTGERMERLTWYADRVLLGAIVAVLVVDQLTKYLVRTNMALGDSWPAEGLFRLTYGTNSGSAFGLFPNQTVPLIAASLIAIGFLAYFYRTQARPTSILRLAIGLQLGGAFGNLSDRLREGSVVDFIDVGWWPIFNVADSSIVVGMAVLIGVLVLADATPQPRPQGVDNSGEEPAVQ